MRSDLEQHISRRVQHPTVERPELQNWLGKMPTYGELIDAPEFSVLYAGPSGNYPGMFQINAQVPAGYFTAGTFPVVVNVGPFATQAGVTISVF